MILNKLTARKACRKQNTTMFNISPGMNWTVYESIILFKKYISSCLYLRLVIVEERANRSSVNTQQYFCTNLEILDFEKLIEMSLNICTKR